MRGFSQNSTCIVNSLLLKDRREAVVVDEAPATEEEKRVTRLHHGQSTWHSPTIPETNIFAPENNPLEVRRFLLETIIFRCELLVLGRVYFPTFEVDFHGKCR